MTLADLLIDFSNLHQHTDEEIVLALEALQQEHRTRAEIVKRKAIEEVLELAKIHSLDLATLMPSAANAKQRKPAAIKYIDPNNAEHTWSGRGRAPAWIVEAEAAGQSRTEFLVS